MYIKDIWMEFKQHTFVRVYVSFRISVERLKSGFPLKPPDSLAKGSLLTESGLDIVVFDMIYKHQQKTRSQNQ